MVLLKWIIYAEAHPNPGPPLHVAWPLYPPSTSVLSSSASEQRTQALSTHGGVDRLLELINPYWHALQDVSYSILIVFKMSTIRLQNV